MKIVTKETCYAVKAIACIARSGKGVTTVKDLVDRLQVPGPFLRKILQILSKNDILMSHKGRDGGFTLKKDPGEITLLDLMEIFHGPFTVSRHIFNKKLCPHVKTCRLNKEIEEIEGEIKDRFEAIKLSSFIN